jgi:hypothetical protein
VAALDPFRDPVYDRRAHESGHLAGLVWFGYSADSLKLDVRHADFGWAGALDRVHRVTGDPTRKARDRAVIAAVGPLLAGVDLDHPSAAADRRAIDLNRADGWSAESWRWLSFERALDLARHEPFRAVWRAFVVRLHDLGEDYVEFHGDEVDAFLSSIPDADLLPDEPCVEATTSARCRVLVHSAAKAVDAAPGNLRRARGSLDHSEVARG